MRKIIYDVAVSLDGFIAAPGGDASAFPGEGDHIAPYFDRLAGYGTVIMGRHTYEYGYGFGLEPGARAYPHMDHHIFSTSINLPDNADITIVRSDWLSYLSKLRSATGMPIYLCGGGQFAGWVLQQGLIDELIIKAAPITLGAGIPLFSDALLTTHWQTKAVTPYSNGVTLLELTR
ncbi:dihydrofolate reductase family protein [Aliiroseovarius sp. F47248L]|uniref:dihydrofolate reductase family protein n=1 Tax=Aliiroseovarius sp. F47248L TaxID=2926420 RepID=UPI001FF0F47F|nr:dihydrofolate reductase family protein [Aliiroseovarius sp. F47248L]MCK0139544.1 dihydrofolate reductase family protein [Aliiroseovarius sp. F47248L]